MANIYFALEILACARARLGRFAVLSRISLSFDDSTVRCDVVGESENGGQFPCYVSCKSSPVVKKNFYKVRMYRIIRRQDGMRARVAWMGPLFLPYSRKISDSFDSSKRVIL